MMKKSLFVKSLGSLFVSAIVVGAVSYSQTHSSDEQKLNLEAFSNFSTNIKAFSHKNALAAPGISAETKINQRIISLIELEVKTKIKRSRIAVKRVKKITPVKEVVAKIWNDIKPEFAAVKYESVKIVAAHVASELLINNKDLVKLYAFNSQSQYFELFALMSIPTIKENNVVFAVKKVADKVEAPEVKDEVSQSMASTQIETAPAIDTDADDLVMFEYGNKESENVDPAAVGEKEIEPKFVAQTKPKKLFDSPLSYTVRNAIKREVGKAPVAFMNTQKQKRAPAETDESQLDNDTLYEVMKNEDNTVYDYSKDTASSTASSPSSSAAASFADALKADVDKQGEETSFIIKAREINLSTQKSRQAVGYEFVPDHDRAERMDDQAGGEIKIGYSLSGEMNTQTGVVQAQGMITTRVELNLANGGMSIPLLNEEGIQKFLIKKGLDIQGNLAMVGIDPSIKDVELDSTYEAKMLFDKNFKNVDSIEKAHFVMFLGVQSGNTLIRYLLDNSESAQKIIYVGDGEMFYEDADFVNTHREMYTFTTRSLLGKKVKELSVDAGLIGIFGTKTTSKKKALNAYELKIPEMIAGSRKYLEFKHMLSTLYVGTDSEKNIEIPGMDFIRRVLQANDMDELGQRCIVQLNLSKDLRDIKVNGKNKAGEMFTETTFLDSEGGFSTDNAELAEKVFILGDMEGQFNAKLEYSDGSSQFLKTFCSEGSYLIEQL